MAVQMCKKVASNSVVPINRVGYAKPSLEVLSCGTCHIKQNCIAKLLTLKHEHSYRVVKNRRVISRGNHIYRDGDESNAIYIVSSGSVKSYIVMENGEEQVLDFYLPGDVFGLEAVGNDKHCTSTISLETTTLCKLPLADLQQKAPCKEFLTIISSNLMHEHNLMLMLARKDADGRLASFLLDLFRRIHDYDKGQNEISLSMTRQDIANYLGLAIETVSRVFTRFQDAGTLKVTRRKIRVYDFECLLKIAGSQVQY